MNTGHVAGGGLGAILGALIAGFLSKYSGYHLSDADSAMIGSAFLGAGIGVGHGIYLHGLSGLLGVVWRGQKQQVAPEQPGTPN